MDPCGRSPPWTHAAITLHGFKSPTWMYDNTTYRNHEKNHRVFIAFDYLQTPPLRSCAKSLLSAATIFNSSVVLKALGSDFDNYVHLPAIGTRGGILLAWTSTEVTITDPLFTTNALSAKVSTPSGAGTPWWITVVYGPQHDDAKVAFLQ